ncbi:hypothetical protein FRC08_013883 [Ceratobasidium sp. 394]|nr:hypothetical protein FRC08_013883 [Ceratobasidium sp. 394]
MGVVAGANVGGVAHGVLDEMVGVAEASGTQETGVRAILAVTTGLGTVQTTGEITDVMIETDPVGMMTDGSLDVMKDVNSAMTGGTSHAHESLRRRIQWRQPVSALSYPLRSTTGFFLDNLDAPPNSSSAGPSKPPAAGGVDGEIEEGEDMEEDEAQMMTAMGFGGFDSTKGKAVLGNQQGAANIKKQRTWRQYMNRRGGFNRPLDKIK